MYLEGEDENPQFRQKLRTRKIVPMESRFVRMRFTSADGVSPWFEHDVAVLLKAVAKSEGLDLASASMAFSQLQPRRLGEQERWHYDPVMGVYGALE